MLLRIKSKAGHKIGIPDTVLLKPGKIITDGERSQFDPGVISTFRAVSDFFGKRYKNFDLI